VTGTAPSFPKVNLEPHEFTNLQVDFITYLTQRGEVVYHREVDIHTLEDRPVKPQSAAFLQRSRSFLTNLAHPQSASGAVLLGEEILMYTALSIYPSDRSGTPGGVQVFGWYLDARRLQEISEALNLRLDLFLMPDAQRQADIAAVLPSLRRTEVLSQPFDKKQLGSYVLLHDFDARPIAVLRTLAPRDVYAHALRVQRYIFWCSLGLGLMFGAMTLTYLERRVLVRLDKLSQDVAAVASQSDPAARLAVPTRADELGMLTDEINKMLSEIQQKQELSRQHLAALATNKLKSQFLATIGHEIRTPMNGVLGMLQVMREGNLSDEQRKRLELAHRSASDLLVLLNDVLDFSKLDARKLELERRPFAVQELAEGITALFAPTAGQRGLALECHVEVPPTRRYLGDPLRLRQVLNNLVGNALKFTAHGTIHLEIATVTSPGELERVRFAVRDTGIGISEDHLAQLFTPFAQGEASMARRFGGTGLGLSIAQELVTLMGGRITVESELGRGTTFCFELPLLQAELALSAPAERQSSALVLNIADVPHAAKGEWPKFTGRILLVEDNEVNYAVAPAMLEVYGNDVGGPAAVRRHSKSRLSSALS
jgi:signal transduction histidine kinase